MAVEGITLERKQAAAVKETAEGVDRGKEKLANEFRFGKWANSPHVRAVLSIIRSDDTLAQNVIPTLDQQRALERDTTLAGETHLVGAALAANIYKNEEAAALYDLALFDTTKGESNYVKEQIRKGKRYAPIQIVGAGGVYGTIASAAILKANPDNPAVGFDGGKRRGGIWAISGSETLKRWWRMNSRNRKERRKKQGELDVIAPGTEDNLNSLGAETQNLQIPFITSAQYPGNNDLGRVLSHDNQRSNNIAVESDLVKVRVNTSGGPGVYTYEYQDKVTGERFFVDSDVALQATGLTKEKLGFDEMKSSTRAVLEQAAKDMAEGVKTPKVLTFLQLLEATTSNRKDASEILNRYGLQGKGDTSRVVRERSFGIGGVDPGITAQEGGTEEVVVFGLDAKTREELVKTERARYVLGLLEFEREGGGFFRVRGIEGRVVGLAEPEDGNGVLVYYQIIDQTPDGPVRTTLSERVPRLVVAAGFEDQKDLDKRIYGGLTAQTVEEPVQVFERLNETVTTVGSTVYFKAESDLAARLGIARMDIEQVSKSGRRIEVSLIGTDGVARKRVVDRDNTTTEDNLLLSTSQIQRLEIVGDPPEFTPVIDPEYDSEIPVAERAEGFDGVYKIGACTSYPVTAKEKSLTSAYDKVSENTKSIFRFVRPVTFFAKKIAAQVQAVSGALNKIEYKPEAVVLGNGDGINLRREVSIPVEPRAMVQELDPNLKTPNLIKYLAASRLDCVFPSGMDKLSFGIKRTDRPGDLEASDFQIQFGSPIPGSEEWQVVDRFFGDPVVQKMLVRLTRESTNTAEINIGIRNGRIDIRNTNAVSVKNTEFNAFAEKYPLFAPPKKDRVFLAS